MALEILGVIEFDRDAPEERPVLRAAGKRKRSPGTSANANDVCGHVRPDSEEENPHIWPGSEDDRDVLARENAELRVSRPFVLARKSLIVLATAPNRQLAQPGAEGLSCGCHRFDWY